MPLRKHQIMSYDAHTPTAVKPTVRMAHAIQDMTYQELDDLASWFMQTALDDEGELNDPRYIATALLSWADDEINTQPE